MLVSATVTTDAPVAAVAVAAAPDNTQDAIFAQTHSKHRFLWSVTVRSPTVDQWAWTTGPGPALDVPLLGSASSTGATGAPVYIYSKNVTWASSHGLTFESSCRCVVLAAVSRECLLRTDSNTHYTARTCVHSFHGLPSNRTEMHNCKSPLNAEKRVSPTTSRTAFILPMWRSLCRKPPSPTRAFSLARRLRTATSPSSARKYQMGLASCQKRRSIWAKYTESRAAAQTIASPSGSLRTFVVRDSASERNDGTDTLMPLLRFPCCVSCSPAPAVRARRRHAWDLLLFVAVHR
jgi:hypothetical protein